MHDNVRCESAPAAQRYTLGYANPSQNLRQIDQRNQSVFPLEFPVNRIFDVREKNGTSVLGGVAAFALFVGVLLMYLGLRALVWMVGFVSPSVGFVVEALAKLFRSSSEKTIKPINAALEQSTNPDSNLRVQQNSSLSESRIDAARSEVLFSPLLSRRKSSNRPTETISTFGSDRALIHSLSLHFRRKFSDVCSEAHGEEESLGIACEPNRLMTTFSKIRPLGKKSTNVFLALHKFEQKYYAIKKFLIPSSQLPHFKKSSLFKRIMELLKLENHGVGKYITCWAEENSDSGDFQTKKRMRTRSEHLTSDEENTESVYYSAFVKGSKDETSPAKDLDLYVQMEYCGKSNLMKLMEGSSIENSFRFLIFNSVLESIQFFESKNICHGNISLESIFFHEEGIKLANFSLLNFEFSSVTGFLDSKNTSEVKSKTELKANDKKSLGLVLLQMISGISSLGQAEILLKEIKDLKKSNGLANLFPNEVDLILALTEEESKRPTVTQIKQMKSYLGWRKEVICSIKDEEFIV